MKILAFAPIHNTPGVNPKTGKPWRDANEFQNEAKKFLAYHEAAYDEPGGLETNLILFDNSKPMAKRAADILAAIKGIPNLNVFVFFCHGWFVNPKKLRSGIQAGFDLTNVKKLAQAISAHGQGPTVPLYACSTGDGTPHSAAALGGDGGFADALRDELCKDGSMYCKVDAHDTAGHTTKNPMVVRFQGDGSPTGGQGGQWIVKPGSKLWPAWRKALQGDYRFQFPLETIANIHEDLT